MKDRPTLLFVLALGACMETESPDSQDVRSSNATISAGPAPPVEPPGPATAQIKPVNACLTQDGEELRVAPVKAVGTEPFWGARVEGRCVTYSTPENPKGTRIWTRLESGPNGAVWNGAFGGKRFQLYVQPMPNCSDGMSDRVYPLEARLIVSGEERRGCAEPL